VSRRASFSGRLFGP